MSESGFVCLGQALGGIMVGDGQHLNAQACCPGDKLRG